MSFSSSGNIENEPSDDQQKETAAQSNLKRSSTEVDQADSTKRMRPELNETVSEVSTKCCHSPVSATSSSPLCELPDEMVQLIFSYICIGLTDCWHSDCGHYQNPESPKFKFSLQMVCKQFKRLINNKSSWKLNYRLYIDSPRHEFNPNGCEINNQYFTMEKFSKALDKLFEVAPISAVFYRYLPTSLMQRHDPISYNGPGAHVQTTIIRQLEKRKVILEKFVNKVQIDECFDSTIQIRLFTLFADAKIEELKVEYGRNLWNNGNFELQHLQSIKKYAKLCKLSLNFLHSFDIQNLVETLSEKPLEELELKIRHPRIFIDDLVDVCNSIKGPLKKLVLLENYIHGDIFNFVQPCQEKLKDLKYLHITPLDYIPHTLQNTIQFLPSLTYIKLELSMNLQYTNNWLEFWPLYVGWLTHFADRKPPLKIDIEVAINEDNQRKEFVDALDIHRNWFANVWQAIDEVQIENVGLQYYKRNMTCKNGNVSISCAIQDET